MMRPDGPGLVDEDLEFLAVDDEGIMISGIPCRRPRDLDGGLDNGGDLHIEYLGIGDR